MTPLRRFVLRVLAFFRSDRAETELAREIAAHLRLLEDDFLARGMSADDARYAARRAFGGVEQAKERQRDARSFPALHGASLDFRLGFRMLIKYPGLTLVGGVAIALGVAVGAAAFEFLTQVVNPSLPLPQGDRIVAIRLWDTAAQETERRALHDFAAWREQLGAIEDLGAYRTVERNLAVGEAGGEPIEIAEISASAFRVARTPPMFGRSLDDADERPGAPPVLVIGYDLWQGRFDRDAAVVGRVVRLGAERVEVVGVMPEGFGFPVAHGAWIPLRLNPATYGPRTGPAVSIFGRLAPDATLAEAQAAISAIGARTAAAFPATHARLGPDVQRYAHAARDLDELAMGATAFNVFVMLFVLLVCANVASLVFARASSRETEILVRSALGASRQRILMQLFIEALVLGGVAALAGLAAASFGLRWLLAVLEADSGRPWPFWFSSRLSLTTLMYAALLTVAGAAIAGIIPALKITRGLGTRLRQATAGPQGLGFGGIWTAVIVTQVAVTVTFPAAAFFLRRGVMEIQHRDIGFASNQYLSARLETDAPAQLGPLYEELARRLEAEPEVAGVTFVDRLPRTHHRPESVEVESVSGAALPVTIPRIGNAAAAINYFDALNVPILSGRGFHRGDLAPGARSVVVNTRFVARALGGGNAIGRRVRYTDGKDWYEIVGVVRDLGMIGGDAKDDGAGMYHPSPPGLARPMRIAIHVKGDPARFAPRLRTIASSVDPALRLHDLQPLDEASASMWLESQFLYRLLAGVSAIALLLSLTGIYSILAFSVSRRTREIGIRVALGADPRRIVTAIFSRALAQVAIGIAAGGAMVFALTNSVTGLSAGEAAAVVAYMAVMMAVCVVACIVPTRRALRVDPTIALREGV